MAIHQIKEQGARKKELHIIDFLQSQQRGDEMALFEEDMREEAQAEAIEELKNKKILQNKKKKFSKTHKGYAKNKLHASSIKKSVKSKTLTLKERFKIKDFSKWFKYGLGYSTSVSNLSDSGASREYLKASITVSPIKYFFLGATFNKDINGYKNIYYQPDFSYSFGYSDWHTDTWSLIYSNYSDNKITPTIGQDRFHFDEGVWELKYKSKIDNYNVWGALQHIQKGSQGQLVLNASRMLENDVLLSSNLKFYLHTNQQQLTLSGKTFLYKKFFVSGSLYFYSDLDKQTDLEPDYAYSFGWVNPQKGGVSIVYSNYYTPTRWGWRDKDGPNFNQGALTLSVNF